MYNFFTIKQRNPFPRNAVPQAPLITEARLRYIIGQRPAACGRAHQWFGGQVFENLFLLKNTLLHLIDLLYLWATVLMR